MDENRPFLGRNLVGLSLKIQKNGKFIKKLDPEI
jgi:hypothetical protein